MTKGQIDRLGEKIRLESIAIDDQTIDELQKYRTSHQQAIGKAFNILCTISKQIQSNAIVTFRIKRFESIISKLERYPEMRFSRMWDIAGCRCILKHEEDVYKLKEAIIQDKELQLIKEYDYILEPQTDGYRSLHLFVQPKNTEQTIEVQLRTEKQHNWATLVEISDLLFDSKLKEYGSDKQLLQFHYLLSKPEELTTENKYQIAQILKDYNYFEKLSEVFTRNYLKVRMQWFELEAQKNHKYFMIETRKDEVPRIESFNSFHTAEKNYLEVYKTRKNANIVLTHLEKPTYQQISIAYSNYILTFHTFLKECLEIQESLIVDTLKNRRFLKFYSTYNLYNQLIFNHIKNLKAEIEEITIMRKTGKKRDRKKEREWTEDIKQQIDDLDKRRNTHSSIINNSMPTEKINRRIMLWIMNSVAKKYERKLKQVLATTPV